MGGSFKFEKKTNQNTQLSVICGKKCALSTWYLLIILSEKTFPSAKRKYSTFVAENFGFHYKYIDGVCKMIYKTKNVHLNVQICVNYYV